ncbi:MAG: hypothetical protein ONB48_11365 [candidate division KSB1 bacterium]|nr:hypothetical protein [candidate division KSB1 bacterium]MDZ7275447.1 hypothetical protein [candidate division KSB1 bacterium]MDZ7286241.1 hypothetical protein [candidate division KSB1 bacterium]MDZ7296467.1 hypothetical protein [candidate division KSB1 bacterium]MDZ7305574.1 hypothetical protein [candidate division KSB1 bacterium]
MRERELVQALANRLRQENLREVRVRPGNQRGADIEGILPRSHRRLFIEAKGVRARENERVAVGEALLQILRHYDYDVVCAIAVPYTPAFEKLLRSIMPGLAKLGIHVLLVRPDEIWHVPPMRGFFPEKHESLLEKLDL